MKKKYEAMVLSCMDPRFQKPVHKYLDKKKLTRKFSAFTIAGGSIGVTNKKFKKWHSTFWENLETSINLHKITKLIKNCSFFLLIEVFRAFFCVFWRFNKIYFA